MTLTIAALLLALIMGIPVAFAVGLAGLSYFFFSGGNYLAFSQQLIGQFTSFPLIAIPFFILTGELMNSSGITHRIFSFAMAVVGRVPGSLGHANIFGSMVFAGISGAAVADLASLGRIEMKAMRDAGYPDDMSIGVTVASAVVGPIIPPSIIMVVYGSIAGIPAGLLFLGGVLPGVLAGVLMMATFAIIFARRNLPKLDEPQISIVAALKHAFWSLMAPVVLLGALFSGFASPTEAAILACLYAGIVAAAYRQLTVRGLGRALLNTAILSGAILIIVAFTAPMGYMIAREQIAADLSVLLLSTVSGGVLMLMIVALALLVVGTFMESMAALILLTPILAPTLATAGFDPVYVGVFVTYVLCIGFVTPPVGMGLFVGSQISNIPLERVAVAVLPYIVPLVAVIAVMIFLPGVITWLPRLVYG